MSAINTTDFIVIFLLSNVVQDAVIGDDNSLLGEMVGAVKLVVVNAAVNRVTVISTHVGGRLERPAGDALGHDAAGALHREGRRRSSAFPSRKLGRGASRVRWLIRRRSYWKPEMMLLAAARAVFVVAGLPVAVLL